MVFSSHVFLFYFLPFVLLLNYTLPFRFLTLMIMLVSYLFYGWANPKWIILMLTSTMVDYFCGLALVHYSGIKNDGSDLPYLPKGQPRNKAQKMALAISMITNLAILGFFNFTPLRISRISQLFFYVPLSDLPKTSFL